jgi:hypothetical protein
MPVIYDKFDANAIILIGALPVAVSLPVVVQDEMTRRR